MRQYLVGAGTSLTQKIKGWGAVNIWSNMKAKKSSRVNSAGRAAYVERNCLMIKDSNFVVVHLEEGRNDGKSGSRLAYKYSLRQKKSMLTV